MPTQFIAIVGQLQILTLPNSATDLIKAAEANESIETDLDKLFLPSQLLDR